MKKISALLIVFWIFSICKLCVAQIQWQKCYGGSDWDELRYVEQTNDGGYVFVAYSASSNGNITGNHGNADVWVVKLNSLGNITWQKCMGGSDEDEPYCIHQTNDGGYIFTGATHSNNGDVSGNHGEYDVWVVKLNAVGDILWQKCYGGTGREFARSIQQTSDGGYVFAGYANTNNGDVSGVHDLCGDFWVGKINSVGQLKWQKCYGGSIGDQGAFTIEQTSDDGYLIAGMVSSSDGDVTGYHFMTDYWVIKTDTSGNIEWQKCLGGNGEEYYGIAKQTYDGGYIVAGMTRSIDEDVTNNHGYYTGDAWLVKLNSTGDIKWQKCYGGSNEESAITIELLNGGLNGYVFAGAASSIDGDVSGKHGEADLWVVEIDTIGNIITQRCIGGDSSDNAYSIQKTTDGGYIIGGFTNSINGDVSGLHGSMDCLIVKLGTISDINDKDFIGNISIFPNPLTTSTQITLDKTYHNISLSVYDIQGKLMLQRQYEDCDKIQLNRYGLGNGMYFLKLTLDEKWVETGKIIVSE